MVYEREFVISWRVYTIWVISCCVVYRACVTWVCGFGHVCDSCDSCELRVVYVFCVTILFGRQLSTAPDCEYNWVNIRHDV